MEYYNVDSDMLDSLEFLIPPVKKTVKKTSKDKNYIPDFTRQPDIQILKKLFSKHSKQNSAEASDVGSSTSVIIKKISKRKFIKQIYKDDTEIPLIKVTVIPKGVESKTTRIHNKRKPIVKRVQSTVSNQESSIHSKNFYLVVQGQRTNKIYEIKSTESEKFSSNQSSSRHKYEDISFTKLSNYKQIIESLNMDKKRKKDRKKATKPPPRSDSRASLVNEILGGGLNMQECLCANAKRINTSNYVKPRKSRVRIIGQLGLTNQDKYVINYAATVDDSPVIANFSHVEQNTRSETDDVRQSQADTTTYTSGCCTNKDIYNSKKYIRNKRDSNVHANLLEPSMYRESSSNSYGVRQRTQGVQVNMNETFSNEKIKKKQYKDQTMQCTCNCSTVTDMMSSTTAAVTKSSTMNDVANPLVVISVYQKPDPADNVSSRAMGNRRQNLTKRAISAKVQQASKNKINASTSRSPSPSNRRVNTNNHLSRNFDVRFLRTNNKKKNSSYQETTTNALGTNSTYQATLTSAQSRRSPSPTEISTTTTKSKTTAEFFRRFPVSFGSRDSRETQSRSVRKKNMVDNYTKPSSVNRRDIGNSPSPPKRESIVKLDIEGDRGHYDVMWHQRRPNVVARASKTLKEQDNRRQMDKLSDDDYGSMENYLMLGEDDEKNTEGSQTLCYSTCSSPLLNTGYPHILPQSTIFGKGNSSAFGEIAISSIEDSYTSTFCTECPSVHLSCPMVVATICSANCSIQFKQSTNATAICDSYQQSKTSAVGNSDSTEVEQEVFTKFTQTSPSCDEMYGSQSITNFFAPIKHYRGDSCQITNPLERDKEIRQLLGLQSRTVTQDYLSGIFSRDTRGYRRDRKTKHLAACISKSEDCKCCNERKPKNRQCKLVTTKTTTTQYDLKSHTPQLQQELLDEKQQQLILNRNIQVYLQIEQFTKQKPIMLTRKQYNKLKKTIQSTVKVKVPKEDKNNKNNKCIFKTYSMPSSCKKDSGLIRNQKIQTANKSGRSAQKLAISCANNPLCVCQEVQTLCSGSFSKRYTYNSQVSYDRQNVSTYAPRQAISSLEIRYANVAYKRVTFSSTNIGQFGESNEMDNRHNYIKYLLTRQNGRVTPNLGTSASQYSEPSASEQSLKYLLSPRDSKQKRPFLRRLMSCLVMHSARASALKIPCEPKVSDVNSSIDSYYISTSLGAIEVTSSMYDTSASFYTTHTIVPMNKIKRGFLSSVRGFLTSRRS